MKKIFSVTLIAALSILFLGCYLIFNNKSVKEIADIAYDRNIFSDEVKMVYIKENEEYVPFMVLTNNYDGNTLLLWKKSYDQP